MGVKQRSAIRPPNRGPESHDKEPANHMPQAAGSHRGFQSTAVPCCQRCTTAPPRGGLCTPASWRCHWWCPVEWIFKKSSENTPSIPAVPSGTWHHRTGRTPLSAAVGSWEATVLGLVYVWASWLFLVCHPGCLAVCLHHSGRDDVGGAAAAVLGGDSSPPLA